MPLIRFGLTAYPANTGSLDVACVRAAHPIEIVQARFGFHEVHEKSAVKLRDF
jgi:hypothetical protein